MLVSKSKEEVIAEYKSDYEAFLKRVKEVLSPSDREHAESALSSLIDIRRELVKLFSQTLGAYCRECGGECCSHNVYNSLTDEEIAICQFFKFDIPEPHWDFLMRKWQKMKVYGYWLEFSKEYCLFLSETGCLLKEFRPFLCLQHVCWKVRTEKILDSQAYNQIEELIKKYRRHSLGRGAWGWGYY